MPDRCAARTIIARKTADAFAEGEPPLLRRVNQRVAFADAARGGRLVFDTPGGEAAAREIDALARELEGLAS